MLNDAYSALKPFTRFHDTLHDGSRGPSMLAMPAAAFRMGDITGSGYEREKPTRQITLFRFAIGVYPVTFAEYDKFVAAMAEIRGNGKSLWTGLFGGGRHPVSPPDQGWGRAQRPVIHVSWQDAVAYCAWLSRETGQTYRLPTEAEWEYSCRAGSKGDWNFGNNALQLGEYAWFTDNAGNRTQPVGEKKPNAWGLHDMHGNVWEWVRDWFEPYPPGAQTDTGGPETGRYRVFRGGCWESDTDNCRAAYRGGNKPGCRNKLLGFRVARDIR